MKTLEIFWDVGSPYTYLAIKQLEQRWEEVGDRVRLRPFLIGGVFKGTGNSMPAAVPAKAAYMMRDLRRWAQRLEVPMRLPGEGTPFPINTLNPMRVAVAAGMEGKAMPFCLGLFHAYWGEGRDVSQLEVLSEIIGEVGFVAADLLEKAGSQEVKDTLRATTGEAVERGAFGAPAIFVGESHYWGNDRLDMALEELLASE